ncbi:MAG: LCP family protein [Desulfitobacteriaceae bacterium]|nr:LCP family protein [Desulfitobacteriaceae bacterium]MDD4346498.1 LCP family protein [Desulfitobacteriaceae bacterium]MDD4401843.1 LCP family protein [Desulfitobacteriaceae bacterium]
MIVRRNNIFLKCKRLSKKKKALILIVIFLIMIFAGGIFAYNHWNLREMVVYNDETGEFEIKREASNLSGGVNILLLGVDERKDPNDKSFRTDSIILASFEPENQRISLLSIPRDSRVQIPKRGWDKINNAVNYGGITTTIGVVQNLTGVEIDGYVKTNFQGFKEIIDTLGGITVNVEKNMYDDLGEAEDGIINLKKGEQVLDGSKALQYARFRKDALADITRTVRQQVVLKAIAEKAFEPGNILKIPTLVSQLMHVVETNLAINDIVKITKAAAKIDNSEIISQTLPGYFLTLDGIDYWGVNYDETKEVVRDLFNGIVVGNTPGNLIVQSSEVNVNSTNENQTDIKIGSISINRNKITASSITLDVSASTGVKIAEVWRNNSFMKGWDGNAITITDSGLESGKEYAYVLKVYNSKGKLLLTTDPVREKTLGNDDAFYAGTVKAKMETDGSNRISSLLLNIGPSNGATSAILFKDGVELIKWNDPGNSHSYRDYNVREGATYYYRLEVRNSEGIARNREVSVPVKSSRAVALGSLYAKLNTDNSGNTLSISVDIGSSKGDIKALRLLKDGKLLEQWSSLNARTYTDNAVRAGATYKYTLEAENTSGAKTTKDLVFSAS